MLLPRFCCSDGTIEGGSYEDTGLSSFRRLVCCLRVFLLLFATLLFSESLCFLFREFPYLFLPTVLIRQVPNQQEPPGAHRTRALLAASACWPDELFALAAVELEADLLSSAHVQRSAFLVSDVIFAHVCVVDREIRSPPQPDAIRCMSFLLMLSAFMSLSRVLPACRCPMISTPLPRRSTRARRCRCYLRLTRVKRMDSCCDFLA